MAFFGFSRVISRVLMADIRYFLLGMFFALLSRFTLGGVWYLIIPSISDNSYSYLEVFPMYMAALFTNQITPMGRAGGEPFIAYVLEDITDLDYGQSIAVSLMSDMINLFPFFTFSLLGMILLVLTSSLSAYFVFIGIIVSVLFVVYITILFLLYPERRFVNSIVHHLLSLINYLRFKDKKIIDWDDLKQHLNEFFSTIDKIARKDKLFIIVLLAHISWLFLAFSNSAILISLSPQGFTIFRAVALSFVLISLSLTAAITPLPGGTGSVEMAYSGILTSLTPLEPFIAIAAAILFRIVSFWLPLVIGGFYFSIEV